MKNQYVSACGMVRVSEIKSVHETLGDSAKELAVYGLQTSPKTLLGNLNRRGLNWYPRGTEALRHLCREASEQNLGRIAVHVNFDSPEPNHVNAVVDIVRSATSECAWAYQLNNLDWTNHNWVQLIEKIRSAGQKIILQANQHVCSEDPKYFAQALAHHSPDYVLLDTSGGQGQSYDPEQYASLISTVQSRSEVGIAIAGGLGPDELESLAWLVDRFGPLSCDAETKLRDDYRADMPSLSRFSPQKASAFICQAANQFSLF